MIFQLGVLFLFGSLSVTTALPPCFCAKNLKPVCGSDGHTYNNECLLHCAQVSEPDLVMSRSGRCDGTNIRPPRDLNQAELDCFCTLEYMPFCGTDGKTYPNRCALKCAKRSAPVEIAHRGTCGHFFKREAVQVSNLPSRCSCPRSYIPVCGSDGTTYANDCELDCISQTKPGLTLKHDGVCVEESQSCTCTREVIPVCGTDGNTYDNSCYLNCAKNTNKDLDMHHEGECDNSVKVVDFPSCTCTREFNLVCGTDGTIYSNPCMLNCARENNKDLHIDHVGPCDSADHTVDPAQCAGCSRKKRPVCGTDGNTYRNPCFLNCARDNDENLHIDYEGVCESKVIVVDSPVCSCSREDIPVCGTDGNTYANACLLECAKVNDGDLSINHQGPCDSKVQVVEEAENVTCTCTRDLKPVCSSNGVTFNNECLMRCAGTHLTVAREGPCDE